MTAGGPHPIRVLLVDDSSSDRSLTGLAFRRFKLTNELVMVEDAETAIELLDDGTEGEFDLILSDINMPGMDGYEFFQRLQSDARHRSIPFAFLTSGGSDEEGMGAYGGEGRFLRKPVDLAGLLRVISAVPGYALSIVRRA